jgi:hypothetical protein
MSHTSHPGVLKLLRFGKDVHFYAHLASTGAFLGRSSVGVHSTQPRMNTGFSLMKATSGESRKRPRGEKNPRRKPVAMRYTLVLKAIPIARHFDGFVQTLPHPASFRVS